MSDYTKGSIDDAKRLLGLTNAEIATMVGVSPSSITKLINGRSPFTETWARRLARGLDLPLSFFASSVPLIPDQQLTFRKRARTGKRQCVRIGAEFSHLEYSVNTLRGFSKPASVAWLDALTPHYDPSNADIAYVARQARTVMGLSEADRIPNLVKTMEAHGIVVAPLMSPLKYGEASTDGISCPSRSGRNPVIGYFTFNGAGDRQRFTLAHELGHILLQRHRIPDNAKDREREANLFAGDFLLPDGIARALFDRFSDLSALIRVKQFYGVSLAFLVKRMTDLQIIDYQREQVLMAELSRKGWRKVEPVQVPVEHPVLLKQMCGDAFGHIISPTVCTANKWAAETMLRSPFRFISHWCDGLEESVSADDHLPTTADH